MFIPIWTANLPTLPEALIKVASGLLEVKHDDHTRERLGDLLFGIADCISAIAENIEAGRYSAERCSELDVYVGHLHELIASETDEKTADALTFCLRYADEAPGFWREDIGKRILSQVTPPWRRSRRVVEAVKVREIAGTIRGVSVLVRGGRTKAAL